LEKAASSSFRMEEVIKLQNIRIQRTDRKDIMGASTLDMSFFLMGDEGTTTSYKGVWGAVHSSTHPSS
jgi:hypothetical protein